MSEEQGSYIQQVHLKGYKSVKDLTVSFQKGLNIIIGANGSGKTNFMEFLDAVFNSNYERLLNNRKFEVQIIATSFKAKLESDINNTSINKNNFRYKIIETGENGYGNFTKLYFFNDDKKIINTEYLTKDRKMPFFPLFVNFSLYLGFDNPLNQLLKEKLKLYLLKWNELQSYEDDSFIMTKLRGNLLIENEKTFLNRIFEVYNTLDNNSTLLNITDNFIKDKWIELDSLRRNLTQFSPIKDFKIDWSLTRHNIQKEEYDDYIGESATIEGIDFQFYVNNEWLNWTQLSDGTKRLFYLIGSVTYAKENEIILMEEPELGVHPHQLTLLMNFLKAESKTKQIIISTHSPQVLNCLKEDELDHIIVARHEGKAGTQMYPLSEEEKGFAAEYMKNQAFLSDYWLQSGFMNDETIEQV